VVDNVRSDVLFCYELLLISPGRKARICQAKACPHQARRRLYLLSYSLPVPKYLSRLIFYINFDYLFYYTK
jgi:hypothetical protein